MCNLTHRKGALDRFPNHNVQVGGFVLSPNGRLVYLRWVHGKCYTNTWDSAAQTLHFQVPDRSQHFLHGAIHEAIRDRSPVNVMLLIGNMRYDVGSFQIRSYQHPSLQLTRVTDATGAVSVLKGTGTRMPAPSAPTEEAPSVAVDSQLEAQCRRLLAAWGVAAGYRRMMYLLHPEEGGGLNTVWYTPDGMLYDILSPALMEWCGPQNRHHGNCVLEIKPVYPAQDVFIKLRTLAKDFGVPVVLLYGRPDVAATDERMQYENLQYSQGLMVILFRPEDGLTTRVHFNVVNTTEPPLVQLVPGEVGERGPLHPFIVAGHRTLHTR